MYPNVNPSYGPNPGFNPNMNQGFPPTYPPAFSQGFNPGFNTGYNAGYNPNLQSSAEAGDVDNSFGAFSSKAIRMAFIRKTYGILSVQLIVSFGTVLAFRSDSLRVWSTENSWAFILSMVVLFASMISLACCQIHRKFPINFIVLGLFTFGMSFMLGMTTAYYRTDIVFYAVLITGVVVIALTLFAMQTKIDFTVYNGILFVAVIVLMVMGLIMMFVKSKVMYVVYSGLGALVFSAYLVVDTQMIVGGNHKYQFSPEDYIFAAITLYTDIINLFLYILNLLNSAKE